jgi:hypothetical protein
MITCIYGMTEMLPIAYIDGREKLETIVRGDLLGRFIDSVDYKIIQDELYIQ